MNASEGSRRSHTRASAVDIQRRARSLGAVPGIVVSRSRTSCIDTVHVGTLSGDAIPRTTAARFEGAGMHLQRCSRRSPCRATGSPLALCRWEAGARERRNGHDEQSDRRSQPRYRALPEVRACPERAARGGIHGQRASGPLVPVRVLWLARRRARSTNGGSSVAARGRRLGRSPGPTPMSHAA
jgi:hypothetical protein